MKVNIMLHEIVNSISKYQRDTEENFWKKISSESIEEFLIDYHLPKEITTSIITDYTDLKKLLVEDVTEIENDNQESIEKPEDNKKDSPINL